MNESVLHWARAVAGAEVQPTFYEVFDAKQWI